MTPAEAVRARVAEALTLAWSGLQGPSLALPDGWEGLPPPALPEDLEAAIHAGEFWLETQVLPWLRDHDGGAATLPPLRAPGLS